LKKEKNTSIKKKKKLFNIIDIDENLNTPTNKNELETQ
jgi:hypothetical protein